MFCGGEAYNLKCVGLMNFPRLIFGIILVIRLRVEILIRVGYKSLDFFRDVVVFKSVEGADLVQIKPECVLLRRR